MSSLLDFEKPIAELEGKVKELRHLADGSELDLDEEIARLEGRASKLLLEHLRQADALAEDAGRPACRPAALHRLRRGADHRLHAPRRRSLLRRRPGDPRWARSLQGPRRRRHGPREGSRDGGPGAPQFRHGAARGLPQGGSPDAAGRAVRAAGGDAGRHAGRHPGHRAEERGQAEAIARSIETCLKLDGADRLGDRRRGRLGRGHRARHRRPRPDARAQHLLGHLAGRLRRHPLAQRRPGRGGGRGAQAHRPGPARPRRWSTRSSPSRWAARIAAGARRSRRVGDAIERHLEAFDGLAPADIRHRRREKYLHMGRELE